MESTSVIAILSLAFGLGILHALDADHVMAVSGLSSTRPGWRRSINFCTHWAMGHGMSLLLIGSAVILFGLAIPVDLSAFAENLVGIVLIAIGCYVIWDLLRRHAHLHFHKHDGIPKHAHWHIHDKPSQQSRRRKHHHEPHHHGHGAVMVGMLHGTAGSAPLLALIPLSQMASPWLGILYLIVFGLGVFVAMLLFGGVLGSLYNWLSRWGDRMVRMLRIVIGFSSIGFGGFLLFGAA